MNNRPPTYQPRPMEIELIRTMAHRPLTTRESQKLGKLLESPPDAKDAFIIKTGNEWLKTTEKPNYDTMLFGEFWYDGELCFLFADTNVGKSVLAVQIGNAISRGEPIPGFRCRAQPQTVLYFDFELSARQFEQRYTNDVNGNYRFSPNFYRVVFNPEATNARKFATYADYVNNALENILTVSEARIIIIDNITCLRTGTEAAAGAIRLMRSLQQMKNRYGLSILVLAHTPKRNPARPVTRNDLQGSKMLLNFADSAFAIGESQTQVRVRYLKQIKQRSTEETYGPANVCMCHIIKPQNFLQFQFTGSSNEAMHLLPYTEQQRQNLEVRVLQLHQQGLSVRQIANQTSISFSTVARTIKRLERQEKGGK
jgi:hypothetical protein